MRENRLPIAAPRLDRLMGLCNALVALKGPLADEPGLRECLQRRLFSEAVDSLGLEKASTSTSPPGGAMS